MNSPVLVTSCLPATTAEFPPAMTGAWEPWRTVLTTTYDLAKAHPVLLLLLSIASMTIVLAAHAAASNEPHPGDPPTRDPVDESLPEVASAGAVIRGVTNAVVHDLERELAIHETRGRFRRWPSRQRAIACSAVAVMVLLRVVALHAICIAVAHAIA